MSSNLRLVLILVAVAVVAAAGGVYYYTSLPDTAVISDQTGTEPAPAPAQTSSKLMTAGPLGEMALGDPKAPNVVIEYASMTCSHCQRFHQEVYRPFKEKYVDTGKVYFIFREFPLDALAAAAIMQARCAPKEQFFPLVDLMFDHQREWAMAADPVTALQNLLKQAGITEQPFMACLKNQTILDGVNWVKDRGDNELGVDSTPTFFINGTKYPGEQSLADLDKLLGG